MSRLRKVVVALLSWNGRQHLEVCLEALRQQHDPGVAWEVWVLDNGSHDGTASWVRAHHPEVVLVESSVNLGFCAGYNRLIEQLEDADAIALLNNDTRPRPGWLAALVDALAAAPDDVAAISGQIVDWSGEKLDFARGILTFDGHAFQKDFGRPLQTVDRPSAGAELLFGCGGNLLIRRASFLRAGGFDPTYFAYLEDVDLGWRLWSGGERVLFAPEAVVHHRSMATSELLGQDHRGFLFERNAFLTAYRNYEAGLWEKMMPAVLLTLVHRTQTLLVQNNPGGEQLTFDPYAGLIANTAAPAAASTPPELSVAALARPSVWQKWRLYGPREFFRRGIRKAVRELLPPWVLDNTPIPGPCLTDGRTVAQLRALTYLLGNLDRFAESRRRVQERRKRSDREIFERFPLYIVPTYPGDERLFGSRAIRDWLPDDLPLVASTLAEVMWMGTETTPDHASSSTTAVP